MNFESPSPFATNASSSSFHFPSTSTRRKSVTLESLPRDPNVVKRQERKITKSHIHIGEVIKNDALMTLHQGNFGDRLINVMVLKNSTSIQHQEERFEVRNFEKAQQHEKYYRIFLDIFQGWRAAFILNSASPFHALSWNLFQSWLKGDLDPFRHGCWCNTRGVSNKFLLLHFPSFGLTFSFLCVIAGNVGESTRQESLRSE